MKYLLDTSVISDYYCPESKNCLFFRKKILDLSSKNSFHISSLVFLELEYGAYHSKEKIIFNRVKNTINEIRLKFNTVEVDYEVSRVYGALKSELVNIRGLNKNSAKKHNFDILLASQAIHNECILVSGDAIFEDLQKIDTRLQFENWNNLE